MITRIVRMSFEPESVEDFLKIFDQSKHLIRKMNGCQYLSIHQDHHFPNVFYTVSKWDSQNDLDIYRDSELFQKTWSATKTLFNAKPSAHSLVEREVINK